jgi:hypothetical protein
MGALGGAASTAMLFYQSSISGAGLTFLIGWGLVLLASGLMVLGRIWPRVREESHAG